MRRLTLASSILVGALALGTASSPLALPTARGMAPSIQADDLAAVLAPARTAPIGSLEAVVTDYDGAMIVDETFAVLDPAGEKVGTQKWRVVTGTGNCCENYLSSNSQGRLFDFGGDYLYFSDDEGSSWKRVAPADPLPNFGEGAVAIAPGGDVIGVAWNPYYGDRLVPFKYEAEEETWYYTTTKLHTPFFDRESLVVIPGPFTVAGQKFPYLTVLKGGYPSKDPYYFSLDGLNYFLPSSKFADQMTGAVETGWMDFKATPLHDWLQTNYQTRITALGKGVALSGLGGYVNDDLSPPFARLGSDLTWAAFEPKGRTLPPGGHMLTDSDGRLHYVFSAQKRFGYWMSSNGGRDWIRRNVAMPRGSQGSPDLDFRASGRLDVTVVAAHVRGKNGTTRDLVYRFTTSGSRIKLQRIYQIGTGELVTGSGVTSTAPRFDFSTLTLLPDGRVAVSFIDQKYTTPTLAIQQ